MRIAHVTPSYHPVVGGLENFIQHLARTQQQSGAHPRIVYCDPNNRSWGTQSYAHAGLDVVSLPLIQAGRLYWPLALEEVIADCDIVHLHDPFFLGATLGSVLKAKDKPICLSTHGGFFHTDHIGASSACMPAPEYAPCYGGSIAFLHAARPIMTASRICPSASCSSKTVWSCRSTATR